MSNPSVPAAPNPAAAFYASPMARGVALLLKGLDRLTPHTGTRVALRLFLTPVPGKSKARAQAVPPGWTLRDLPFEGSHVTVWEGQPPHSDAPRVLLVHGWAGDARHMLPLAEAVHAAGFNPLLLDLPAHGRAGFRHSNLVQWSRALFAVSARFGPWQGVVGHSLGALALAHALGRGLPAERAVLLAPSPPPRVFMRWMTRALGLSDGLAERMARRIEHNEGVPLQVFEPDWLGAHVTRPTLMVHDATDRTAPLAGSQALVNALPRAELRITEGLGHRRVLSDAQVLRWVAQHLHAA